MELLVYGQDRVATVKPDIVVPGVGPDTIYTRELGEKQYELKDHLGNVRVVTSDIKLPTATTGQMPFESDVLAYYNHYPFGMLQPGGCSTGGVPVRVQWNGAGSGDRSEPESFDELLQAV